jgi:hypothetical protein
MHLIGYAQFYLLKGFSMAWFIVFNATFNNISVISWRSVLLVKVIRIPGENHRPATCHWQTLSHDVLSRTPRHERDSLAVIGTDCICSCKSSYHTITITTASLTGLKAYNITQHNGNIQWQLRFFKKRQQQININNSPYAKH